MKGIGMNGMRFWALVASVALVAGCGSSSHTGTANAGGTTTSVGNNQAARVFVGKVDGTNAYVAVATSPTGVVAYVCDGARLVAYLAGKQTDATLAADEPAQLVSVTGKIDGNRVQGTVRTPDGADHPFTATKADGNAGYYRAEVRKGDTVTVGGWIRLADGTVRGAVQGVRVSVNTTTSTTAGRAALTITSVPPGDATNLGDGSSIPADAQPLTFIQNVKCGIAAIRVLRASQRTQADPNFGNAAAQSLAEQQANAICNPERPGGEPV